MDRNIVSKFRVPTGRERIFSECVLSFESKDSGDGVYLCVEKLIALSCEYLDFYRTKSNRNLFLFFKGNHVSLLKFPEKVSYQISELPRNVQKIVQNIIQAAKEEEEFLRVLEESLRYSKPIKNPPPPKPIQLSPSLFTHNLIQLNNKLTVPSSGWKCAAWNCGQKHNLWMNLTDGRVLCGRAYFDLSGGNGHSEEYFKKTNYPLVVKLGTVSPNGADVFSYPEDKLVEHPQLSAHLAHFGLQQANMHKTEPSMSELEARLELSLNERNDEHYLILEEGTNLKPLFGPGLTGLANLGNSCYMNATLQVFLSLPTFLSRYVLTDPKEHYGRANMAIPILDLSTQLTKLATALASGRHSVPISATVQQQKGLRPSMFKYCIGHISQFGHSTNQFSTQQQQDAFEFVSFLIDAIQRTSSGPKPTEAFHFQVEQRVVCGASGKVRYSIQHENAISFPIDGVPILNQTEVDEYINTTSSGTAFGPVVNPLVDLPQCLEYYFSDTQIEDYFSNAIMAKCTAKQRIRFHTFPDVLILQAKKFNIDHRTGVTYKNNILINVPEILDLSEFAATGLQPGEALMPDEPLAVINFDHNLLNQLTEFGFSDGAIKRALYHTDNSGIQQAMVWLLEHSSDQDFDSDFVVPTQKEIDQKKACDLVTTMGIPLKYAILALKRNGFDPNRAVDWYFTKQSQIEQLFQEDEQKVKRESLVKATSASTPKRTGPFRYRLVAFITHIGTSSNAGHYVAHVRKSVLPDEASNLNVLSSKSLIGSSSNLSEMKWVLYNDADVRLCEELPSKYGYIYFYQLIPAHQ